METNDCKTSFCTCPVSKCPRHPKNHNQGCTPCIRGNLKKGKMPACFFRAVHDHVDQVTDYTMTGFATFVDEHKEEYETKFRK